eukprot:CAMPEP_0185745640 /NCGR_PEP_ID=MMETSP1174-20130828/4043_1 /TAXON_ID=35687 /ORGANISM="Dictyocha speculum, Strain CCMP1381" /LENGTH=97 /DNA_ID=CAMNT_0028419795 /DNA_START=29 /DNA_END=318 /DNA_ORIENTATION=+
MAIFAPSQGECFVIIRAYWDAHHAQVKVLQNTLLTSPNKQSAGAAVDDHHAAAQFAPKKAEDSGPTGLKSEQSAPTERPRPSRIDVFRSQTFIGPLS